MTIIVADEMTTVLHHLELFLILIPGNIKVHGSKEGELILLWAPENHISTWRWNEPETRHYVTGR